MADKPDGKETVTSENDDLTSDSSAADHLRGRSTGYSHRSFLRASAAAGLAGVVGTASAQEESEAASETVDVVEAGADPSGQEPIDGVLESVVDDGVVVEFPEDGEFRTNGFTLRGDDFELRGNGARLYPEGGSITVVGQGWTMDGFELDMRSSPNYPSTYFRGGDWTVSRCIWRGQAGTGDSYAVFPRFESGTTATFRDCYWPDGAVDGGERSDFGCIGTFANNVNSGTLRLERCWFEGWSEDTTYVSEADGKIELVDCYFRNTIVGPRVSDVTMRGVKTVHTEPIPIEAWSGSSFQSGVWLNGEKGVHGEPLIEDCDFYIAGPAGGPPLKGDEMPGATTIRNTRIHSEGVDYAVRLGDNQSANHDITLENVTISGNQETVLDGNVRKNDVSTVDGEAADPSPHIPEPPEAGSVPEDGSAD